MSARPDGLRNLVSMAQGWDSVDARDVFGELVKRFQDAAFAYAYAVLGERTAAEDAVQAASSVRGSIGAS